MALYQYGSSSKLPPPRTGKTEFEILKESHRFLREDEDDARRAQSWDEQLAAKYYESLYREFAVCDLKHYKSGNFALRWRTEDEVLAGNGETTCGNTRCRHHEPRRTSGSEPALTTLELPFVYEERGEQKSALVKVVLCPRCVDKLMWKRRKEKDGEGEVAKEREEDGRGAVEIGGGEERSKDKDTGSREETKVGTGSSIKPRRERTRGRSTGRDEREHRKRSSRSRSPRETKKLRFS
ncbi:folate-sensitive fragile site protein Fra10Ac1-domain-containing protein [Collybia nuda]|uniref:Folate-sensitive fragile site protein Fra10Ac1-domain-containing protein n=1 Tax=Collybia nuda TaxID=64659 RepID=A0A9P5YAI1_9AGAR|nr:folate-sensitive fragile site protein Fra10Ac1-domain-containing protein [Collybia nuda]